MIITYSPKPMYSQKTPFPTYSLDTLQLAAELSDSLDHVVQTSGSTNNNVHTLAVQLADLETLGLTTNKAVNVETVRADQLASFLCDLLGQLTGGRHNQDGGHVAMSKNLLVGLGHDGLKCWDQESKSLSCSSLCLDKHVRVGGQKGKYLGLDL